MVQKEKLGYVWLNQVSSQKAIICYVMLCYIRLVTLAYIRLCKAKLCNIRLKKAVIGYFGL